MKRFFTSNINQHIAILEGSERDHCIKVLRTQEGEQLEIVDGKGNVYIGVLSSSSKSTAIVQIQKELKVQTNNYKISMAICIPKNPSRWEWFLEKATEIGINEITPIISKRSEKITFRRERNEQIILSAFKQSGQLFLPKLNDVISFKQLITSNTSSKYKFIAHCTDLERQYLGNKYKKGEDALVLIGPEGDFSEEEITLAVENNFAPVTLGESRLRVETAGVIAIGIIKWVNSMTN